MSKAEIFFYEHIGHMQISVLTLKTFKALNDLTDGQGVFVPWVQVVEQIQKQGFSKKQSESELERFCYGFECVDKLNSSGEREIAYTNVGVAFLRDLISESPFQACKFAFLMRPSKRKDLWNVTIQESTFFNPGVYELIAQYRFRKGPARDFLRTISLSDFVNLLQSVAGELSIAPFSHESSIEACIEKVEKYGKYWASVGGKYSWFVFWQRFELDLSHQDWVFFDSLVEVMIRPPEWGGGKDLPYNKVIDILKTEERFAQFRDHGIIRPLWKTSNVKEALFRLTAAGFLMWERRKKGSVYEWWLRKNADESFNLSLCNASDLLQDRFDGFNRSFDDQQGLYLDGDLQTIISELGASLEPRHQIDLFD